MTHSLIRTGVAGLVALICSIPALAQEYDFRLGRVDVEDLQMESYPPDSNAAAVILFDQAKASFNERFELEVEFIRRVKILTEAGYDYATVRVPYYVENRTQDVAGIRGFTHNLDHNGEPERTSLSSRSVFREDADGSTRVVSFTMPNLRPGSVIEYRYVLRSTNPVFLPSWNFQHEEPVLWSEYVVEIPSILEYVLVMQGTRPVLTDREQFRLRRGGLEFNGVRYRYLARDMPAMREEPFITTINNYRQRLNVQLARINPVNAPSRDFLHTWQKLNEDWNSNRWYGSEMRGSREIRRLVPDIIEGLDSEIEIVKAIYDYVRETMEWNGHSTDYPEGVVNAFRARTGNSADINLLLICMLREAGLQADPLVSSLRSRGRIQQLYPIINQFNYLIVYVDLGEQFALLDATEKDRPMSLLPIRALNGVGWRVSDENFGWINIQTERGYTTRALAQVRLTPEGTMTGSVEKLFADYSALSVRRTLRDLSDAEYIRNRFLQQISGAVPVDHHITAKAEIDVPLTVRTNFETYEYAQAAGDFIYVNPFVIDRLEENPFRTPTRDFPVDFAVGALHQYVVRIEIPDGFEVHEHPARLNLRLDDDAANFVRVVQEEGGVLSISTVFRINSTAYQPNQYGRLREFYNRVVAANAEQVVFRRISPDEHAAPVASDEPGEEEQ